MKRLLPFALIVILASCEIYLVEDPNAWDARDQYVGSYQVEEFSQTTQVVYTYGMSIRKACCNRNEIRIDNFYGEDITVHAYIDGNRFTIPLQQRDGYEIEGTGRIVNGHLEMTFFARDMYSYPAFTDFVTLEGWPY